MKDQKDNTSTLSLKATYDLIDKAKKLVSKINKGAEEYPEEFSQQARARIEAEKLKARKQLEQRRNQVPWSGGHLPRPADDENLRKFILQVFLVFAREACKVGSQGLWTVERIRLEAEEYLRKFVLKAYSDEGYDKQGRKLEEMTDYYGSIQEGVWWAFKESAEYRQFEQELLAVAEQQARGSPQSSDEAEATEGRVRKSPAKKQAPLRPPRPKVVPIGDLDELRKWKSLSQVQAAAALGLTSSRQIRGLVEKRKLTRNRKRRIVVDKKFEAEFNERHTATRK